MDRINEIGGVKIDYLPWLKLTMPEISSNQPESEVIPWLMA